ncbi:MAG TPA: hypothetical protein VN950_04170 [Terriglobales bacterium]|nr:hypothetical protein [Terriglobales bacterium]
MISRRSFLVSAAAAAGVAVAQPVLGKVAGREPLTRKERVDRALAGRDVDRAPFTHWHHFGPQTPEEHAKATLDYHWKYKTDIVKVMSDYPYPKPEGNWYELKVLDNPFPEQIRALELIRDGLHGDAYILETLRANISETLPVVVINEQGEEEKNKDEQEFSWCCLRGRGWRGTKRRRA